VQKERFREGASSSYKYLMFEDICPTWASKLRTGLDNQDIRILVHDSKHCIVGEAWGYTGRQTGYYIAPLIPFVGCWKCVKFGIDMGRIAKHSGQSDVPGHLQLMINNFVEHWNEKHSRISQRSIFSP
jgi:hypothetical protein